MPAPPHVFAIVPGGGDAALEEGPGRPGELRYGSFHHGEQGYVFEANEAAEIAGDTFAGGVLGGPARDLQTFQDTLTTLVGGLPGPVEKATLVLPDTWLRLTFVEVSELPRKIQERDEILRWKLKRLLPFRVEDLRIDATPVTPFPNQEEPLRLMIGFAVEMLIAQIEEAFAAAGVELGRITNASLATLASLDDAVGPDDLAALVMIQDDAYTLSYFRAAEPLLYRYKALNESSSLATSVHRDLRMTTGFVAQHFPGAPLKRAFLAAAPEAEDQWLRWLQDELDVVPEPLSFEHFQLARTQVGPSWLETAPMLGAVSLEVR